MKCFLENSAPAGVNEKERNKNAGKSAHEVYEKWVNRRLFNEDCESVLATAEKIQAADTI